MTTVVAGSNYDSEKEVSLIRYASSHGFGGIILLSAIETDDLINTLRIVSCPVILVNRFLRRLETDVVCGDNYRGGYMATSYLLDAGHKQIMHLAGPQDSSTCFNRLLGYSDALKDADIALDDLIDYGDLTYEYGYNFGNHLIDNRPDITAVLSAGDTMTSGLVDAYYERGLSIPDHLSVISMDRNISFIKGRVKVTSISQDNYQMGCMAGKLLKERLQHPDAKMQKIVYSPVLEVRDSVKEL